jgi:hypothetical protein
MRKLTSNIKEISFSVGIGSGVTCVTSEINQWENTSSHTSHGTSVVPIMTCFCHGKKKSNRSSYFSLSDSLIFVFILSFFCIHIITFVFTKSHLYSQNHICIHKITFVFTKSHLYSQNHISEVYSLHKKGNLLFLGRVIPCCYTSC